MAVLSVPRLLSLPCWQKTAACQWLILAILSLAALLTSQSARALEDHVVCKVEALRQERINGIPDYLLQSIALIESGRWDSTRKESYAWPWSVMAEGVGRVLPSKAAAIAEVKKLQAKGVRNIDVGCMQVNLQAHPTAFASLEDAFDPAVNAAYAARFLRGLYASTSNWATAGAYYHSQTPAHAAPYKAKLLATWNKLQGGSSGTQLADASKPATAADADKTPPALPPGRTPAPHPTVSAAQLAAATAAHHRALQQQQQAQAAADRTEARLIADAYRQARLEEYRLRKQSSGRG